MVVIIGILAAIAIPKFANTKEKAVVASMKSDLRNLVTAQEASSAITRTTPAARTGDGRQPRPTVRRARARWPSAPRAGNMLAVKYGSAAGWSATVTNPAVKSTASDECGIYVGTAAAPDASLTTEGAPGCY